MTRGSLRHTRKVTTATMANFRVPDVKNEPNVRDPKSRNKERKKKRLLTLVNSPHTHPGTVERQKLLDAVKSLRKRAPLEVSAFVAGKSVSPMRPTIPSFD